MAYYSLFLVIWDEHTHKLMRSDARLGETFANAANATKYIKSALAAPQGELTAHNGTIGMVLGRQYDEDVTEIAVLPNHAVLTLKHNQLGATDWYGQYPGQEIASVMHAFVRAQRARIENRWTGNALVPLYFNDTDVAQSIEVHMTKYRLKNDPKTRWEDIGIAGLKSLVPV